MGNDKLYRELFRVVNDLRISLPTLDAGRLDELTGGTEVLAKKQDVIGLALKNDVPRIGLLTPLLPELHGMLEKFVQFAETSPRLFWLPLRYESTPILPRPWTAADAQSFAEDMAELMDRRPKQARGLYLAMPFCGVRPANLGARVFHGRTRDCGPFAALTSMPAEGCRPASRWAKWRASGRLQKTKTVRRSSPAHPLKHCPVNAGATLMSPVAPAAAASPTAWVQHGGRWIDYLAGFVKNGIFHES